MKSLHHIFKECINTNKLQIKERKKLLTKYKNKIPKQRKNTLIREIQYLNMLIKYFNDIAKAKDLPY